MECMALQIDYWTSPDEGGVDPAPDGLDEFELKGDEQKVDATLLNNAWSSAAGHCGIKEDRVLCSKPGWRRQVESIGDWSVWLAAGDELGCLEILRRNAGMGLPCGSGKFIFRLQKLAGRELVFHPRGRPRKGKRAASPFVALLFVVIRQTWLRALLLNRRSTPTVICGNDPEDGAR